MVAHGVGAAKRSNAKRSKAKQARKKAAKATAVGAERVAALQPSTPAPRAIPSITEDDLLSFQFLHFATDVQPHIWFVDAETALNYDPQLDDDGLGYYEDGVKRTLTDEQIEMFRHSEREMLLREEKIRAEQKAEELRHQPQHEHGANGEDLIPAKAVSPLSDASSMEDELLGLARMTSVEAPHLPTERPQSPSSRSGTSYSADPRTRLRANETPYDQRRKRKWEDYIEENDPIEGSLTHRRIVREMDQPHDENVELDY